MLRLKWLNRVSKKGAWAEHNSYQNANYYFLYPNAFFFNYTTNFVGVYWFRSVRSFVCPTVRPSVPHPMSALQSLQFWLDPFDVYPSYQATSEGVSRVKFLAQFQNLDFWLFVLICNFDIVLFWLGFWCESLVWVIMGRRGISERRRSRYSSLDMVVNAYHFNIFGNLYCTPQTILFGRWFLYEN